MNLKHSLPVALLLCSLPLAAQRRASADVEVKTLTENNVVTVTKSVYCSNNGRLVSNFHTPAEYIVVTNAMGECQYYFPSSNEVLADNSGAVVSSDELLSVFLFGRIEDLGVSLSGYMLQSTEYLPDGLVKKTYRTMKTELPPVCEIVYNQDYLPIYNAVIGQDGRILSKSYYSRYETYGYSPFPLRTTQILYNSPKDSTIVRTIYSNVRLDGDDAMFDFTVPQNAKPVVLPEKK